MKVCAKCGTQNADDAVFCAGCGAPIPQGPVQQGAYPQGSYPQGTVPVAPQPAPAPAKSVDVVKILKDPKVIIGAAAAVVIIIVALLFVFVIGGRGDVATAEGVVQALIDGDGKKMLDYFPSYYVSEYAEEEDISKSEAKKELTEAWTDTAEAVVDLLDEQDIKVSTVKAKIEDEVTGRDLRLLKEDYKDDYNAKVKAAEYSTVTVKFKTDGDKNDTTISIFLIKIGKSWYVDINKSNIYSWAYYLN